MAYEYPTNYSNGSSATGPGGFFIDYPTTIIPEFGSGILIMLFAVVFAVSSFIGTRKALLVSCFTTGIISMFFAVRGWVNVIVPIGLGIVSLVIIILSIMEGDGGL